MLHFSWQEWIHHNCLYAFVPGLKSPLRPVARFYCWKHLKKERKKCMHCNGLSTVRKHLSCWSNTLKVFCLPRMATLLLLPENWTGMSALIINCISCQWLFSVFQSHAATWASTLATQGESSCCPPPPNIKSQVAFPVFLLCEQKRFDWSTVNHFFKTGLVICFNCVHMSRY